MVTGLLALLVVVAVVAAVLGFVVDGLFWFAIVGIVVAVVAVIAAILRHFLGIRGPGD